MTKEELEKEADNYVVTTGNNDCTIDAYLAGAEPREKRIEELIALINAERERQEKCDDVHLRKIADLEEENKVLAQNLEDSEIIIAGLKAQIEKMKCWCNCKNYLSCLEECCRKNISFEKGICYNCKKWELRR